MNTCANTLASAGSSANAPASWRRKLGLLVATWRLARKHRADRRIDDYFRREREARERHLAHAGDWYELERLERDWERRHQDFWRVY